MKKKLLFLGLSLVVIVGGYFTLGEYSGGNFFRIKSPKFDSLSANKPMRMKTFPKSTPKDVFIMQDDGTFIRKDSAGTLDLEKLAKNFYQTNPDKYDFIAVYTTFPIIQNGPDYFEIVKREIIGLGINATNYNNEIRYGSKKLNGIAVVNDINKYNNSSGDLLHELSHYWLAHVTNFNDDKTEWITRSDGGHWSHFLDMATREKGVTYLSPIGGSAWVDNGNGTFTQDLSKVPTQNWLKLNDVDLYFMGLMPKEKVSSIFLVVTNEPNVEIVSGKKKVLTIDDLIKVAGGPRVPDYSKAPNKFKIAFVLLTNKDVQATQDQINKINWIAKNFPKEWNTATKNLSTINQKVVPGKYVFPQK